MLIGNTGYWPTGPTPRSPPASFDAVAFGTAFLANPDLPERIRRKAALNAPDPAIYTPGSKGYTDYPTLAQSA